MDCWEPFGALVLIWLTFVTVVGFYAVRIVSLLHEQWHREQSFRLWLAARRGRAIREAAREADAAR